MKICSKCGCQIEGIEDTCHNCGEKYDPNPIAVDSRWMTWLLIVVIAVIFACFYFRFGSLEGTWERLATMFRDNWPQCILFE